MRSAAHRANILNPTWDTVGISVLVEDNYYYVVQQFSFEFENVLSNIDDALSDINSNLNQNAILESLSQNWLDLMIETGEFGTNIQGQSIFDDVNAEMGISNFYSLISKSSDIDSILLQLASNPNLDSSNVDKYGFSTRVDSDGLVNFVLVFGK